MSEVADSEIEIITDFVRRFREHYSQTQAISSATVALGLPNLGQVKRIDIVLAEMHKRGMLVHAYDIEGSPCYMESSSWEMHSKQ